MSRRKPPWLGTEDEQGWFKRPRFADNEPNPVRVSGFIRHLNNLSTNYPQQVLVFLQRQCLELGKVVQCPNLSSAEVYILIRGLTVALEYAAEPDEVQPFLAEVLKPEFIARDLLYFIAQIETLQFQDQTSSNVIGNTVVLLHHLVTAAPERTQQLLHLPVDLLCSKLKRQQALGAQVSWIAQKHLQDLKWMVDASFPEEKSNLGKFMSPTKAEQIHRISVFPIPEDMLTQPGSVLRPNPLRGPHPSEKSYLELHFRLLREDFIKPLRDGISSCFTPKTLFSGTRRSRKGMRLYNNVYIIKVGTAPTGVIYMARFDSPFSSFVSSKRLMNGSLVCLISNDCDDILFATVMSYNRDELVEGYVWLDLKINSPDLYKYFYRMRFTMLESPAFFEGYQHVLEGLQEMDHRLLPFRRYIVECNTSVFSPYYLDGPSVEYDLTTLNPMHGVSFPKPSMPFTKSMKQKCTPATETGPSKTPASTSHSHMSPNYDPTSLSFCTTSPSYRPTSPSYRPTSPSYRPTSPNYSPTSPSCTIYCPTRPTCLPMRPSPIPTSASYSPASKSCHPTRPAPIFSASHNASNPVCTSSNTSCNPPSPVCIPTAPSSISTKVANATDPPSPDAVATPHSAPTDEEMVVTARDPPSPEVASAPSDDEEGEVKEEASPLSPTPDHPLQDMVNTEIEPAETSAPKEEAPSACIQLQGSENKIHMSAADPFNSLTWSAEMFPHLDESQVLAIKTALTREFALIQGPPGTGKTFIGLTIVQTLLRNERYWNKKRSPILVVCYTNHALDQFLEGILKFNQTGVVRIGGRIKNKKMEKYSLKNIRKERLHQVLLPSQKRCFAQIMEPLRSLKKEIPDCSAILENLNRGILTASELEPEIQADNLFRKGMESSKMLTWLNISSKYQQEPNKPTPKKKSSQQRFGGADVQQEADERYLDDYDYEGGEECQVQWVESKFAYIVPANPSEYDARILSSLKEEDIMSQDEVPPAHQLWLLKPKDRWRLYRKWHRAYTDKLKELLNFKIEAYQNGTAELIKLTVQENQLILKQALVIGMTTTGAAKYRSLLQKIQPKIVMVEEAAEVLEAHVLTTLNTSCEHLIMIGDHKQLRPKPADYTLEKKYKLGISLFERMINNDMPYVQLVYQHRMRPEISQLLVPLFYKHLKDHQSVSKFENIRGLASNVFFIQHQEQEDKSSDSESYSNSFEASFLVCLCRYLLQQNYSEDQVTILTPYTGQLLLIQQKMKEAGLENVPIKAVDNFQGEENDIILLSLVRSNKEGNIGFMRDKNRLCVAFSRARMGFFCIGNLVGLSEGSKNHLWKDILQVLEANHLTGEGLTLVCQTHTSSKTVVKTASDFKKVPDGGCDLLCQTRLKCGHPCRQSCHPNDMDHVKYSCKFPCKRILCPLKHECPKKCYEPCSPCWMKVEKVIPNCGHTHAMPCSKSPAEWPCEEPCEKRLKCNHACTLRCKDDCSGCKCRERIDITLACSHIAKIECHRQLKRQICRHSCEEVLECGHMCKGTCHECLYGRLHVGCSQKCTRVLLCSHVCKSTCREICPPCPKKCLNKCMHSLCDRICGAICFDCILPCSWACSHYKCSKMCYEICDRPRCNIPCEKILKCLHPCVGLCGEPCPQQCRVCDGDALTEIFFGNEDEPDARFVTLEDCGHAFEVSGLDQWMDGSGDVQDQHIQMKVCPRCSVPIQWNTRYCNIIKEIRHKIDTVKKKIQGSEEEIEGEKERLLDSTRSNKHIAYLQERNIVQKLSQALTMQGLKDLENTLNFFTSLSKLKAQAEKCTLDRKSTLKMTIRDMEQWLLQKSLPFTGQQLQECRRELRRISYLCNIFERLSYYEHKAWAPTDDALGSVIEALEVLNKWGPFTEAAISSLQGVLQKIDELMPVSGIRLSEDERVMITTAMDMGKGHWYSCPRGHLYTVGECGRPMEESSCPECGAAIGGQNHNPAQGNATTDIILGPLPGELLSDYQ
ncbi:NFX1-type zinc finger-containing protein 1-like isoform X2 [Ambystoma mexicanum]